MHVLVPTKKEGKDSKLQAAGSVIAAGGELAEEEQSKNPSSLLLAFYPYLYFSCVLLLLISDLKPLSPNSASGQKACAAHPAAAGTFTA